MQDILRKEVKLLKAFNNISYRTFAEAIGVKTSSFYSWLKGQYNFGFYTEQELKQFILQLKENSR